MENKENKYQMILLGSVIICAIFTFVTIAWAAFSTTLKISGTATIKAQTWNVYWSAASVDNTAGATTATAASIDTIGSSTSTISLTALSAEYNTPGQKAVYHITATNGGTFNAKFTQFTAPTIDCKGASESTYKTVQDSIDAYTAAGSNISSITSTGEKVCKFITYELKTKTAFTSTVNSGGITAGTDFSTLANTLVLDKVTSSGIATGGSIELELIIYFDKNEQMAPEALPTEDVSVRIKTFEAKFDQA